MIKQEASFGTPQPSAQESSRATRMTGSRLLGFTSFGFILLQSVCTAVMALSGLRFLIGVASLAAASGLKASILAFHADAIRIPMMTLAVGGSLLNLYVLWRIRSLRARSASQWRMAPVPAAKKRAETFQIALALATLILVAVESSFHLYLHGQA